MIVHFFSICLIRGLKKRINPRKKMMVGLFIHTLLTPPSYPLSLQSRPLFLRNASLNSKQSLSSTALYAATVATYYTCMLCSVHVQVFSVVYWFWGTVRWRLHQENPLHCQTKATGPFITIHVYVCPAPLPSPSLPSLPPLPLSLFQTRSLV